MAKYTVLKNTGGTIQCIQREDGASIPVCDGNADYQQYLIDVKATGDYPVEVIPDPVKEDPTDHDLLMAIAGILEAELA
jgi:hypothetical protein